MVTTANSMNSGYIFPPKMAESTQSTSCLLGAVKCRKTEMEENLRQLSAVLGQASGLVSNILEARSSASASASNSTSGTSTSTSSSTSGTSTSNNSAIINAFTRARQMIRQSTSRGQFSRLSQRERLRATSSSTRTNSADENKNKKRKADETKVLEFVVLKITDDDWTIHQENVVMRGLIEVSTDSTEAEIRAKIGETVRVKFPMVENDDFDYLKANRRKLTEPVNCGSFGYKQLKALAGQGALYVKLKLGLECFLEDNPALDGTETDQGRVHLK